MEARRAGVCEVCCACITPGDRLTKVELAVTSGAKQQAWVHEMCAPDVGRLVCKHWSKFGECKFGASCQFLHPAESAGTEGGTHRSEPASAGGQRQAGRTWQSISAEGGLVSLHVTRIPLPPTPDELQALATALCAHGALLPKGISPGDIRGGASQRGWLLVALPSFEQGQAGVAEMDGKLELRPGGGYVRVKFAQLKRRRVQNEFRCSVFRRWLEETFGLEMLRSGEGVLDVAGGKGELAFELVNLSKVPATVVDPRPLRLGKYVERHRLGLYQPRRSWHAWEAALRRGEGAPLSAAAHAHQHGDAPRAAGDAPASKSGGGGGEGGGGDGDEEEEVQAPRNIRVFFETWGAAHYPDPPSPAGASSWPTALVSEANFEVALDRARALSWDDKGLHEPAAHEPAAPEHAAHEPVAPEPANLEAVARRAATREGSEGDEDAGAGEGAAAAGGEVAAAAGGEVAAAVGVGPAGDQVARVIQGDEWGQGSNSVVDLAEARRIVGGCSVVVGMHPDQAAQAIVEFAISSGKPFAVVPCCVYSSESQFRTRRLPGSGKRVTDYASLVEFLSAGRPGVQVADLDFEGKSTVIYRL
ncbi:hypothetical protein T484DRAFT_1904169 [Baffinella frigidus]|nr:hypothetical protein T484DRAFT_1904169 [Cryptophyta sp. CCMP2293]